MFSSFRNRFGIPGVISVIALVFAMFGGAYAASNSGDATASAKKAKKGPRGPKGPKGATGAQGPAGAQGLPGAAGAKGDTGAAGANGKDGTNGTNGTNGTDGTNGTNGKTVLSGTATPGASDGTIGDFYIETDVTTIYGPKAATGANGGWGTGTQLKGADGTNGENGESVEVTLLNPGPQCAAGGAEFSVGETSAVICNGGGSTQTGSWAVGESSLEVTPTFGGEPSYISPISFTNPLPGDLQSGSVHFIPAYNGASEDPPPTIPAACNDGEAPPPSAENPEADPGHLCVFSADALFVPPVFEIGPSLGDNVDILQLSSGLPGASRVGATLAVPVATGGNYYGSWAVTAPAG